MTVIYIDKQNYPELYKRMQTPFMKDWMENKGMAVNNGFMPYALWNLAVSHRDVSMWIGFKMKPNKHWKISQAKEYFGLVGSGDKLLDQLKAIQEEVDRLLKNL